MQRKKYKTKYNNENLFAFITIKQLAVSAHAAKARLIWCLKRQIPLKSDKWKKQYFQINERYMLNKIQIRFVRKETYRKEFGKEYCIRSTKSKRSFCV
jgi:hypothetical protein